MEWDNLLGIQNLFKRIKVQQRRYSVSLCVCTLAQSSDSLQPHGLAHQEVPLSMGFFRQEYWSRLPFPTPGDLPEPGIVPKSLVSPALPGGLFTTIAMWEAPCA